MTSGLLRGMAKYGNAASTAVQYAARSIEVQEVQREVYELAADRVLPRLRDYARGIGKWAIVLDVDGTVLSDADFNEQIEEAGHLFDLAEHTRWLEAGNLKAIPGAKEFLDQVRQVSAEQGGRGAIFYVTNCEARPEVIESNLRSHGLFEDGDFLVKSSPELNKGECRRRIEAAGYKIEATFGDSLRDHFEVYGEEARGKGKDLLDEAVREGRAFVIPNTIYGQWQKAYNTGDTR